VRAYRRLFGPNVRFDAEVSGIVFAESWLDRPIPGADPRLREQVMSAIREARASSSMNFADIVRGALHQMVLSGTSSADSVALLFGIHERTLRKRLAAGGTSLQRLVSRTRFELAKQLLENTQLPISEIATALHFADAAVFSRAFRAWSRTSPRDWRARGGDKAPLIAPVNSE
jgi:AraC-like DNA-binding protein